MVPGLLMQCEAHSPNEGLMRPTVFSRSSVNCVTLGVGAAAGAYAAYVAVTWWRYGAATAFDSEATDPLLDRFMPTFEVGERHHVRVAAPAAVTLAAARLVDLQGSTLVRTIIKAREVMLGAIPDDRPHQSGLLAEVLSLGWGVLADDPGREVVIGAVTKPWEPNVTFRALPPDQFAAFNDPGYVKIAWTLRADPTSADESVFRTETRALATDRTARDRFRRYWSFLSPGIIVIRWAMLGAVKKAAERRACNADPPQVTSRTSRMRSRHQALPRAATATSGCRIGTSGSGAVTAASPTDRSIGHRYTVQPR
jgi:hypothetical protein